MLIEVERIKFLGIMWLIAAAAAVSIHKPDKVIPLLSLIANRYDLSSSKRDLSQPLNYAKCNAFTGNYLTVLNLNYRHIIRAPWCVASAIRHPKTTEKLLVTYVCGVTMRIICASRASFYRVECTKTWTGACESYSPDKIFLYPPQIKYPNNSIYPPFPLCWYECMWDVTVHIPLD